MTEKKEELANSFTHAAGIFLFLIAIPFLVFIAKQNARIVWPIVCYAFCLLIMYVNSTIYHSVSRPDLKKLFRIIDHISIFLLIGGTFTPIVVYNMGTWEGGPFLISFWCIMVLGMVFKFFFTGRFKLISTLIYIAVAWFGAIFAWPLLDNMNLRVIVFILAGGLFYTAGTFFYMRKRLLFHHAIWHLFVIAGSISHFFAIRFSIGV